MSKLFPENDPNRLPKLAEGLFNAFEALAVKEDFPPDQLLSAISNAAAIFAANHGIDARRYVELQAAMILDQTERKGRGSRNEQP
jgi:hypothetical protein